MEGSSLPAGLNSGRSVTLTEPASGCDSLWTSPT